MSFLLKIYFIGMITFIPSTDGTEMAVLLQDVRQAVTASDGSTIAPHLPLLIARAEDCLGPCRTGVQEAAMHLFEGAEGVPMGQEQSHLDGAIGGGAAMVLEPGDLFIDMVPPASQPAGSLTIPRALTNEQLRGGTFVPTTEQELEDFGWVASIGAVKPGVGNIDPGLLGATPGAGRLSGRLRLDRGTIRTYSLVRYGEGVAPLAFRALGQPPAGSETASPLADSVVAEIQVDGCEVYLRQESFSGQPGAVIRLEPESCTGSEVVEVALLNLPSRSSHDPSSMTEQSMLQSTTTVGSHFELFYELAALGPGTSARPVPHVSETQAAFDTPARSRSVTSDPDLLERLGLGPSRGGYSSAICPLSQYP